MLVASLRRALESLDAEERRQATSELPRARIEDSLPLLVAALGDADWRVRKEATVAARAFGADPQLLAELMRVLAVALDVGQRNAIVDVLAAAGPPAIEAVRQAFLRLDADGRKLCVDALAKSGSASALDALQDALGDRDENVRAAAVEAVAVLGAVAPERAAEILLARLGDREPVILVAALEGLTGLGVPAPWPRLAPLFEIPTLRSAALAAAALVELPEAARAVADILIQTATLGSGKPGLVRSSPSFDGALRALGHLAKGDLAPGIREVLRAAGPEFGRRLVARALPSAAGPRQLSCAGDDGSVSLRAMALRLAALVGAPGVVDAAVTSLGDHLLADEAERALATIGAPALPAMLGRLADEAVAADARGVLVDVIVDVLEADASRLVGGDPVGWPSLERSALDALRTAAADREAPVAVRALRGLARLGGAADLEIVAGETLAPARVIAAAAEGALLVLASRHPAAARSLVDRLAPDSSRALPTAILIGGSATETGVSPLVEDRNATFLANAATAGDPRVRRAAVEAVSALRATHGAGYPAALEVLGFALTDEEHEVQLAAARALGRLCSAPDAPRGTDILELVQRSGAADLLAATVRAIGEGAVASGSAVSSSRHSGGPFASPRGPGFAWPAAFAPSAELVAALAQFARGAPSQVALAAVDALASAQRSGTLAASAALAGAVDHADEAVVKAALLKLNGDQREPADQPARDAALVKALRHSSPAIRVLAAESTESAATPSARAEVARLLPSEPERHVAEAFRRALKRADGGG